MSRARHTTTCALARHRSECEFYIEHFVVQLYLYVVCILCIYTLVYFFVYVISTFVSRVWLPVIDQRRDAEFLSYALIYPFRAF